MSSSSVAAASEKSELAEAKAAPLATPLEVSEVFCCMRVSDWDMWKNTQISLRQHQDCIVSDQLLY